MADSIVKRIVTSILVLGTVGIVTFLFPSWVFCIIVLSFVGLALYEFLTIVEKKGLFVYKRFAVIVGSIIPIATYLRLGEGFSAMEPFLITIACLFTFVLQFIRREEAKDHLTSIAITLFALFYISWFFSFFIKIKALPDGANLVAFLILVTKSLDIGAYFIGKKFGKSPLIPRISPRKTKIGAVGGLIFSTICAVLLKYFLIDMSLMHAIMLGLLLGVIGQVGDLAESLFKRDFDVKDAGSELPGLGGVLDVMDSLLFTAPIFYFYVKILL